METAKTRVRFESTNTMNSYLLELRDCDRYSDTERQQTPVVQYTVPVFLIVERLAQSGDARGKKSQSSSYLNTYISLNIIQLSCVSCERQNLA